MKKYCFIATSLFSIGLIACSSSHPTASRSPGKVTVRNDSDSQQVEVFWTAKGCGGVDLQHGASGICHQEAIGGKKTASYTFDQATSDRAILLYRSKEFCALPYSDLADTSVPSDETLQTDGCSMKKDPTESSMLRDKQGR